MGTPVASSPSANLATPSSPTTPTASASARSATAALVDDPSKRSNNHPSSTLSSVAVVVPAPSKGLHEKKVESESHTLPKKRERAALAPPAAKTDHTIDRHVVQDEDSESESEQTDEVRVVFLIHLGFTALSLSSTESAYANDASILSRLVGISTAETRQAESRCCSCDGRASIRSSLRSTLAS